MSDKNKLNAGLIFAADGRLKGCRWAVGTEVLKEGSTEVFLTGGASYSTRFSVQRRVPYVVT